MFLGLRCDDVTQQGCLLERGVPHPTAAVRLRFPVARIMEDASAATTVAPSRLHENVQSWEQRG